MDSGIIYDATACREPVSVLRSPLNETEKPPMLILFSRRGYSIAEHHRARSELSEGPDSARSALDT
jgi:hypothetical protein